MIVFVKKLILAILVFSVIHVAGCSSCQNDEEPVRVSSSSTLKIPLEFADANKQAAPAGPNVRVINIGPSKENTESPQTSSGGTSGVPSDVGFDSTLTTRLKEKLNAAFAGRGTTPPDIEIFTGAMSLDNFSKFYEEKGYKIQRTSVPATQVIEPLLEEKPELSSRISLSKYAGVTINQVIVEGANISAADKYIDPETYDVIYKTFVTVTKMK